ncbi:MAG TPA: chemotaxis protein CheD [Thermoanaerobaculia bacterium]
MSPACMPADESPQSVYLHPGHIYTTSHATLISTVLGSSVAVSLWDPHTRKGGMNHFLLPAGEGPRYGTGAMAQLLDELLARGAVLECLIARIFGGASVMSGLTGPPKAVAMQNIEAAQEFLTARAIRFTAEHTGGRRGRKVLFHTGTGQAYVKEF